MSRKKFSEWSYDNKKNIVIALSSLLFIAILVTTVYFINNNLNNETVTVSNLGNEQNNDNTPQVDVYELENVDETTNSGQQEVKQNSSAKLTVLGELMMGGQVTKNVSYSYAISFKKIYNQIRTSDFTYATLGTSITTLDTIDSSAKSKYLVTDDILNATNAMGIDALSVASDHIMDFGDILFKNTVNALAQNSINVAGLQNNPVYLEKGDKKIAIISTNNVIIGTSLNYTNNNINIYNVNKMKEDIRQAKENADVVIVDVHWGRDYIYGVTDQMRTIAKTIIDAGADLVMGTHALGIYPLVMYNGKPIIYSTGYLMTDSDLNAAKENFIFDININENAKISSIEMTPTYIKDKTETLDYFEYDKQKAQKFVDMMNRWQIENGLNSSIENEKIIVKF